MIENKPRFRNENPNVAQENEYQQVGKKVFIGAWAGVNDNEAQVKGLTISLDRPAQAPNWKHCSQILNREFVMFEKENKLAYSTGEEMGTYSKVLTQEQYDNQVPNHVYEPRNTTKYSTPDTNDDDEDEAPSKNGKMGRFEVLKNLVDTNQESCVADREICNDRHENTTKRVSMVTVLATCGAIALLITVIKLFV